MKITDKMRLDWMQNNCGDINANWHSDRWVMNGKVYKKIRRLIDFAIKSEKKGRGK